MQTINQQINRLKIRINTWKEIDRLGLTMRKNLAEELKLLIAEKKARKAQKLPDEVHEPTSQVEGGNPAPSG